MSALYAIRERKQSIAVLVASTKGTIFIKRSIIILFDSLVVFVHFFLNNTVARWSVANGTKKMLLALGRYLTKQKTDHQLTHMPHKNKHLATALNKTPLNREGHISYIPLLCRSREKSVFPL